MPQNPKLVFFSDIHNGTSAARTSPAFAPDFIQHPCNGMHGPGRIVTPAA
ncbi:MAG TPA: hypothetical protein VEU33_44050 [Archangium sp.]|nr:hypothetical protein [Archangium sp.]